MNPNKWIVRWLLLGCLLVFVMVVVGGITRLTHSGLSMTDWHLITDTFPPMTEAAWQQAFEAYKTFPEYQKINQFQPGGFTLDDYKDIYFWEWFHRFIGGRLLGPVFLFPFLYFLYKKWLKGKLLRQCITLLGMGAFQGFLGWFMVKSGLVDNPDVSHFRLALHLTFAFITFAYTFWVALGQIYPEGTPELPAYMHRWARITLAVLILQIIYGGFVAGLDAGWIHNHWPMMSDGQWMHDSIWLERPTWWQRITEGKSGVQFVHRSLAMLLVLLMGSLMWRSHRFTLSTELRKGFWALALALTTQFALGVFTLLYQVPLWLGVMHQAVAFVLLAAMTFVVHRMQPLTLPPSHE